MPETTFDNGWHAIYWKNGDFYCRYFLDGESYLCNPEDCYDDVKPVHRGPTTQYAGFPNGPVVRRISDRVI